ncbi:MAG: PASTA domain-containing protein [Gemmatimonadales bacterium]|nr:PASTA domain-containing protein [Gemmatimonadales bacterium]
MKSPAPYAGRLRMLRVGVLLLGLFLAGRVVQIQLFQHNKYDPIARSQWGKETPIKAERGNLYDRQGRALALSVTTWRLGVSTSQINEKCDLEAMLSDLSEILPRKSGAIRAQINKANGRHTILGKNLVLTHEERKRLKVHTPVTFEDERSRIYPFDGVGGSLIGFYRYGIKEVVATGLEYSLGGYLDGRAGLAREVATPARQRDLGQIVLQEAAHGQSLQLTMDVRLQVICENHLTEAVEQYGAIGGSVLILEPATGDILAAAGWPLLETRAGRHPDPAVWNNRNFTRYYEPGSVFKIFSMASMLRHGAIDTATVFDCTDINFGSFTIRNDDGHSYGDLPLMCAFSKSSNIYFARAVGNLSANELYRDLIDFGFGQTTGLPYPGQVRGILNSPVTWSGRSKPTISIGHEVAVTPLQLGLAVCAVANGGTLMAPRMVRQVLDNEGRVLEELSPAPLRRVMAEPLAELLLEAMARVVNEGTGVGTKMDWITAAGKTGTAQKSRDGMGYTPGAYIASFAGILPQEDPRLVILTILDEPTGAYHYASQSAVPLFRDIVMDIKNSTDWLAASPGGRTGYLAEMDQEDFVPVPDVQYLSVPNAAQRLGAAGLVIVGAEKDGMVVQQIPAAGTRCRSGDVVTLTVSNRLKGPEESPPAIVCPDFLGLSNRQVRSLAARLGVPVAIEGLGYVVRQNPAPGRMVTDRKISLKLETGKMEAFWR